MKRTAKRPIGTLIASYGSRHLLAVLSGGRVECEQIGVASKALEFDDQCLLEGVDR